MPSLEKEIMFREIKKNIEDRPYLFVSQFKKITVAEISGLRNELRKASDNCLVVKNSVAQKVFEEIGLQDAVGLLEGQTVITSCHENPQNVSKILVNFSKGKDDAFKINGAWLEGKTVEAKYVKELASLPSRIELIAKVVGGVKSPITGFVLTLKGVLQSFAGVLNQIVLQKEEA